ncbi:MAG: hypothetical protein JXR69_10625 [Candidatus Delongbacteria bacterium]|nr:hypothetical protein [Candidatus Delongbacteria bacterium]
MKPNFNKKLFWDVEYDSIDFDINVKFVIERVVTRGNLKDWFILKKYYGVDRIKSEVVNIRYLDKLTFNFLASLFKIKKEKFRCFNTEQSIKELWNY